MPSHVDARTHTLHSVVCFAPSRMSSTSSSSSSTAANDVDVFVYLARAPLHPGRFARALSDNFTHVRACGADIARANASSTSTSTTFRGVFRATGVVWIASRPNVCGTLKFDATAEESDDDEDTDDDDTDDDEKSPVSTTTIDVDCGAGDWSSCDRGACELPPGGDARAAGGDRRQHVVFEGFDMDAASIKACLDACLLTKEEDEDDINRGGEGRDVVYCAKSWPSVAEVNADAGVEVVDRTAKHKVYFPSTAPATREAQTTTPSVDAVAMTDGAAPAVVSSSSSVRLGGDVGIVVPEAFTTPKPGEPQSKTFVRAADAADAADAVVVGHYFPDMPCLACGAPWWIGESWNSTCANCGADDRCYDANQQPLRAHRRKYGEFIRALERLAMDAS